MKSRAAKGKTKNAIILLICILAIGLSTYIGAIGISNIQGYKVKSFGEVINRGLDLQGGVSILEEVVSDSKVDAETMERTKEQLNLRVNKIGVSEIEVKQEGTNRIRIDIPGKSNAQELVDLLSKTGELKFKDPSGNVVLTGNDVASAKPGFNEKNQPVVNLKLKDEGTKKFAEATAKYVGQKISIYMDEQEISSPTVNEAISGGNAQISGMKDLAEAKSKAAQIEAGALPVTLKYLSVETVGPTVGQASIPLIIKAGIVGLVIVFLFMIFNYRIPGLIADIALVLFMIITLLVFMYIKATLTLPGIAGFLLTVGMAVDANVLIFERTKEELKLGKSIKASIDAGFERASSSIIDSNLTTILAGVVLYALGSGTVKGFALTLVIGIIISMFTALTVTRFLLKLTYNAGILSNPSLLGVRRREA